MVYDHCMEYYMQTWKYKNLKFDVFIEINTYYIFARGKRVNINIHQKYVTIILYSNKQEWQHPWSITSVAQQVDDQRNENYYSIKILSLEKT